MPSMIQSFLPPGVSFGGIRGTSGSDPSNNTGSSLTKDVPDLGADLQKLFADVQQMGQQQSPINNMINELESMAKNATGEQGVQIGQIIDALKQLMQAQQPGGDSDDGLSGGLGGGLGGDPIHHVIGMLKHLAKGATGEQGMQIGEMVGRLEGMQGQQPGGGFGGFGSTAA